MADAPDPDGAKDDAAPAAATPPDQGSAMELELSQALIEVRRLTLFAGPALGTKASLAQLTRSQTLWTRRPGPAQTRPPLHQLRWMPIYGPQGVPPLQETANGRRYPAQRLSPRPGAGQPLRSGSRANAPRAPLTRQAIQTPRYPGTIFSLTATSTSERYGGRCRMMGCSPRLLPSAEAPATPSSSSGDSPAATGRANAKPQGKGQFTLDLTWTAIDRDLWPLGSWNKSLGEHGPKPRLRPCRAPRYGAPAQRLLL